MARFERRITRIDVYLAEENGHRDGVHDKRCTIEARLAGHHPTVVSHHAVSLDDAIVGATDKLFDVVDGIVSRRLAS